MTRTKKQSTEAAVREIRLPRLSQVCLTADGWPRSGSTEA